MIVVTILSWIVCGLFVGTFARLLVPGRQTMSLSMTTLLGIGGAFVGGFLYSLIRGGAVEPFSMTTHVWYGWIVAVLGAMLLVGVHSYYNHKT